MVFPRPSSLFVLARTKRNALFFLYVLVLGSVAIESIGIVSFYPLVDILQDANQLAYYRDKAIAWVPILASLDQEEFLSFFLLGVGAIFVFKNVFLVLAGFGNSRVITGLYCIWVNRIFKIYLNKPYSFFLENKTGDLVQRKIMQTQRASSALHVFIMLLSGLTTIAGVFLVLCFMNPKVTLAVIFLTVPVYYFTMKLSKGRVYKAGERIVELEKHGFGLATEVFSGIKQVKLFGSEEHFKCRVQKIWGEYARHLVYSQFITTLPRPVLETLVMVGGIGVLYLSLQLSVQGREVFPILAVFAVGMYRVLPLTAAASTQVVALASSLPSVEIVATILQDEKPADKKGAVLPPMTREIEFQNVSFSYQDRETVLSDMSLKFESNKFYGLVGVSGSGKSTVIDLIAGFFKPQKGRVLVDGTNINDVDISTWLCQLGLISQEAFIFSGTIEDNICFGVDAEDRDQDRIREASRIAYTDKFIDSLPQGYQTMVGERGLKLSGGQRQRLAIARAIYLDSSVLIFDEATSSLDAHSEKKVQEAIEAMHGKRTVIVVAHRLVTVAGADYIYVIENGSLAEEGTHRELRAGNGLYSRLCAKQSLV